MPSITIFRINNASFYLFYFFLGEQLAGELPEQSERGNRLQNVRKSVLMFIFTGYNKSIDQRNKEDFPLIC